MRASTCRPTSIWPSRRGPTDATGATGANLDLDPDRGLPDRPGHLRARQACADRVRKRRQLLDDGAALNLDRPDPVCATANHVGDANAEAHGNAFGVPDGYTGPGPLTDGDALRDSDAHSLSRQFAAALAQACGCQQADRGAQILLAHRVRAAAFPAARTPGYGGDGSRAGGWSW